MPNTIIRRGSLALYKNRPVRVTETGKKIEIEETDGSRLSVRPKDITLLHPGPLENLNRLKSPEGEVQTAWELLAGETTTLEELAELAYDAFTPDGAWALWQMVEDGLYFSGQPDAIVVHDAETVAAEQAARAAKAAEEAAWQAALDRFKAGRYEAADELHLTEVVNLALEQGEQSRVLKALNHAESPQNAHAFLLAIGYWPEQFNPYPLRLGLETESPQLPLGELPEEPRRDLTHLTALAIDDAGNQDPDDAISLDGERLWVHVADAAALIPPDSPADLEARGRAASLYLPEGTVTMLPRKATQKLGLGLQEISPALSLGIDFNESGEIASLEVVPSLVRVTRLSYQEADERLDEMPFSRLYQLALAFEERRQGNGSVEIDLPEVKITVEEGRVRIRPLPALRSRDLVREAMLMAGEAVARFGQENELPLPYSAQDPPDPFDEALSGPAGMFARRRSMKRSQQQTTPGLHTGLGMPLYVQVTSPLRRYMDLVTHQQLRAFLRSEPFLDAQEIMARVGASASLGREVRLAERLSNDHWKLIYLQQNPDWRGEGIILDKRGSRDLILIPELDLETQLYQRKVKPLNAKVQLRINEVNLTERLAHFQIDDD